MNEYSHLDDDQLKTTLLGSSAPLTEQAVSLEPGPISAIGQSITLPSNYYVGQYFRKPFSSFYDHNIV
jgi:hypothetical protein